MKTLSQFTLALVLILGVTATRAHADLLLEPYLGYAFGKATSSGLEDNKLTGVTYGGRVGFQKLGFMGGLDYMTGKWKTSVSPTSDVVPSNLGVFFGYNFPILVRAWAAYNFMTKQTWSTSGSADTKLDGGDGIKLGVGFTALPFLSLNLEYLKQNFTKANGNTLDNHIDNSIYILSVSAPFNL